MSACESTQPGSDGDQRASGFPMEYVHPVLIDVAYCSIQKLSACAGNSVDVHYLWWALHERSSQMKEQLIKDARPGTGPEHIRRDSDSSAGPSVC